MQFGSEQGLTGCALMAAVSVANAADVPRRDYRFDGSISRAVLENYLSRAITAMDLFTGKGNTDDNIRMLTNVGTKFAGRTVYEWLRYAWRWVREHEPAGFLQMPGSRCVAAPTPDGRRWYWANTRSETCPEGFSQETTIKTIWAGDE